ncbi:hypothetical protein GCM10009552_16600 [Rothia nasimurium]
MPDTVTCETAPRMRVRSSDWKPFITDITVINAVTLMAMQMIETVEMKEMNWLRRLARV